MRSAKPLFNHNYFSVHISKRGRLNIIFTFDNKKNIKEALNKLGYACAIFDGKNIFIYKDETGIKPVTFMDLWRAFKKHLISLDLSGSGISQPDLISGFQHQNPLRNSRQLHKTLAYELTEKEKREITITLKKYTLTDRVVRKNPGNTVNSSSNKFRPDE